MNRGSLFVIAAPSGAGKTSLVNALADTVADIVISVSHTTRLPRTGETDGADYHFTTAAEFERMIANGELLEHALVFGCSYGTSRSWVEQQLQSGIDVILEIDWQGARQIRLAHPETVSIFILPPALGALRDRLEARGKDSAGIIEQRMAQAREELSHYAEFDYLVINDDFSQALSDLITIVRGARLGCRVQQHKQASLLASLGLPV